MRFNNTLKEYNSTQENTSSFAGGREYEPYYNLWCAVIEQGIRSKDVKYLLSNDFILHCFLIGLNPESVYCNLPLKLKNLINLERWKYE